MFVAFLLVPKEKEKNRRSTQAVYTEVTHTYIMCRNVGIDCSVLKGKEKNRRSTQAVYTEVTRTYIMCRNVGIDCSVLMAHTRSLCAGMWA